MLSNDQDLADRILHASRASNEPVWQLPLWDGYREDMKSEVADLKNVAGRNGGAINAAAFLENFVATYSWGHLDIAGTIWNEGTPPATGGPGATGVGVRLFTRLLTDWLDDA
jgi:leucyl aminopeptidase